MEHSLVHFEAHPKSDVTFADDTRAWALDLRWRAFPCVCISYDHAAVTRTKKQRHAQIDSQNSLLSLPYVFTFPL